MMFDKFFAPLAIKVFTGATVALVLVLGVVMWRADAISKDRDDWRKTAAQTELKLKVSNASLASLTLRMAALVREGELRAERLEEAMEQVAEDTAPLREQADKLERGEIDITEVEGL